VDAVEEKEGRRRRGKWRQTSIEREKIMERWRDRDKRSKYIIYIIIVKSYPLFPFS